MNGRALVCIALAGCVPELADDTSIVRAPRLLATRAEPAEQRPGQPVTTTALWGGPDGPIAGAPVDWAFCTTRKAFTEPGPVAPSCLAADSPELIAFGAGETVTGTLPDTACRLFGPDAPDPLPGEAASRPADPDGTGGYYQPLRVALDGAASLAQVRIRCGLPGATPEQARQYLAEYVDNTNPSVEWATAVPATIARGAELELTVRWPACTSAPCGGAEPYLWFDPVGRELTRRREALRVSWLATGGAFSTGHTGRSEAEADATETTNRWTAPDAEGRVYLSAVLRDDRGGVAWTEVSVQVE